MVDKNTVKILAAIPTSDVVRHGVFYDCFAQVKWPNSHCIISYSRGQSPAAGRNILIRQAKEKGVDYIFFIDDDVILPPDVVERLLSHDKDIVTGLYLHRPFPHRPILFDRVGESGRVGYKLLTDDVPEGLIKIKNCGLGCVMIKMSVFDKLKEPYITLGQLDPENWCDDIKFFNDCRDVGFDIWCDTSVKCGHLVSMAITPFKQNGKWFTAYNSFGTGQPSIPQQVPSPEALAQMEKELAAQL
jgi:glycosyltransferase involved in cell wall biosynthesis